jgi:hypothetical protein
MLETNESQLFRAAEGDFGTPEWPIGGVFTLERQDHDHWIIASQWGQRFQLTRRGLRDLGEAIEAELHDADPLALPEDLVQLWEGLNTEIQTRQGCAASLGQRLDDLAERVTAIDRALGKLSVGQALPID